MDGLEEEMESSGDEVESSPARRRRPSGVSDSSSPARGKEDDEEDSSEEASGKSRGSGASASASNKSSNSSSSSSSSSGSSSGDEGPQKTSRAPIRRIDDDEEEDEDEDSSADGAQESQDSQMRSQSPPPGTPDSDAPPAPPPPIRHECEMPSVPTMSSKIFYVKLPNFLSIDTREYDPNFYEDEIDDDEQLDNEGRARMKLKVENTIRWRKVKDEDGNEVTQSNARVVEWSDGSRSMYLGSEIFDVNEKSIGENSHLYIRQGSRQGLQAQAVFHSKLSIRPYSTESFTHRKLTLSLADRSQKTQKIRMLNNPGQDPEARLNELSKKEDDKMKATLRRETKQRRIQERSQTRGPNASYLEPDYDDEDDDGAISLSAIKKNVKSRQYNDDSDDESASDDQEYSDDSDPEFGKIQRKSERKIRQVVEDSDDE